MLLETATTAYLRDPDPGYALLIAAPAGAGKTYHGVRLAERVAAAGHRVLYAGPRRAFWYDVTAEQQRPNWWYFWQPRHQGDLEATPIYPATCRWEPQISAWMTRGYDAMDFCANARICGWDYIRDRCPFHKQKERGENIIFGQHAHVALGHPLMDKFHLVIGDELPLSAFLHPWTIPISQIVPSGMEDIDVADLLRTLKWLCVNPPDDRPFWDGADLYTRGIPGGVDRVRAVLDRYRMALSDLAYAPELRTAGQADEAPYFHLVDLASLMLRETQQLASGRTAIIPRVRLSSDGLTLLLRRTPPKNLPRHVVWLDATGDAGIYEALLDRPVRVIRPQIRLTGRVHQLWASANNRGAMLNDRPGMDGQLAGDRKVAQIRAQIARILDTHHYQQPAVISYKPIAHTLIPGAPHTHFGAARGTNALQECDALFVVGAPLPNLNTIGDMAAMLFFERDEPFRNEWHALDVPFTGQAAAHSVGGFWDDPDLTVLLRQLRESELVQAVHRARPLRRDVDIWLLTNVVAPGLPVRLVSLHQLFDALDADGRPLTGIDIQRWPEVLDLAATEDEPLTAARLMATFAITKPTAKKWIDALLATGRYAPTSIDATGQRGPKTRAVVKRFTPPK